MAGIQQTPVRRITTMLAASGVMVALTVLTATAVSAAPGRNNDNAKVCRTWSSLYRADGSVFADRGECISYAAEGGTILTSPPTTTTTTTTTVPPDPLPFRVVVNAPSSAAGTYGAAGAEFGPPPTEITASLIAVNDGSGGPGGCSPVFGFPAGAIAVIDRGGCSDDTKAANAQAGGAAAVIFVNDTFGVPTVLQGVNASITIPSVVVSQADGNSIKAGLPATGTVSPAP